MSEVSTINIDELAKQFSDFKLDIERKDGLNEVKRQLKDLTDVMKKNNIFVNSVKDFIEDSGDENLLVDFEITEDNTQIIEAMIECSKEIGNVKKNSENTHFKNAYADINEIRDTLKPVLCKNNLLVFQTPKDAGKRRIAVKTLIYHTSGQHIKSTTFPKEPDKSDIQGYGSAYTYLCRYALNGLFQLSLEDDDDGNKASDIDTKTSKKASTSKKTISSIGSL